MTTKLPELLAPAGSRLALEAAIDAGADAVYLGGSGFNARINAANFSREELKDAVSLAHRFGVKVYQTVNTVVYDKEIDALIEEAQYAYSIGVDAFIITDLGAIDVIHAVLPNMPLHASTQMSSHNALSGEMLKQKGISRMVVARESSLDNLRTMVKNSPIEIEAFVHGALCVCHSGQCLFSSVVGGRSGNRGECAQPCRLPYKDQNDKDIYPLSLKDLSLAEHVVELIDSGVSSLKIEGRMKSPEYVYHTVKTWRRLLDERRNATKSEMDFLTKIFSRDGFTDGYFNGKINTSMLGVRSEKLKTESQSLEPYQGLSKRIPIDIDCHIRKNQPICATFSTFFNKSIVLGKVPLEAQNCPTDEEQIKRSLLKFGNTVYQPNRVDITLDDGLMVPVSFINELRRAGIEALEKKADETEQTVQPKPQIKHNFSSIEDCKTAVFYDKNQITQKAVNYFDICFLPLEKYDAKANGFVMPPVIFDSETERVMTMVKDAVQHGAKYALVGNFAHLSMLSKLPLQCIADYRFNVTNTYALNSLNRAFAWSILSPELTLPQVRDIYGNKGAIVYGRLPLMTLEKCVSSEVADCKKCASNCVTLVDRRHVIFPVLRCFEHRNIVYNSLPTCMFDKIDLLKTYGVKDLHFIFSVERPDEVDDVILSATHQKQINSPFRRFPS